MFSSEQLMMGEPVFVLLCFFFSFVSLTSKHFFRHWWFMPFAPLKVVSNTLASWRLLVYFGPSHLRNAQQRGCLDTRDTSREPHMAPRLHCRSSCLNPDAPLFAEAVRLQRGSTAAGPAAFPGVSARHSHMKLDVETTPQ